MSGATGAAGGAGSGLPGGSSYGGVGGATGGLPGVPPRPAGAPPVGGESAASTSLMPPVASGGGGGYGSAPQPPAQQPAPAGFSQPTTYTKGQPTPPRGTRTGPPGPAAPAGSAARRPGPAAPVGRVRKARLRVTKADPWSVMKVSFLLSLAVGVVIIVATAVLWMTLDALGVFDSLGSTLKEMTGNESAGAVDLMDYVGFGKVMMFTMLIAVVDVVLMTALATLSAFIYNTAAGFTGGVELTLAEED
ncbi:MULTISPECIES: DUF3566 domain-containing protein [unclassified Kitasatospora]|uniref:DUF3566 domain-containing protein n=1 Tax=unclassified Kitasatospora TaxID=2633591 RepID=UPI0009EB2C25|nr:MULTISPECIES: DUF3566 domain-containing protein [unclassified Kitasatospora]